MQMVRSTAQSPRWDFIYPTTAALEAVFRVVQAIARCQGGQDPMMRRVRSIFRLLIEVIIFVAIATLFLLSRCNRMLRQNSLITIFK